LGVVKKDYSPHVLGIDDGPFEKGISPTTPIVGVMTEGARLVEAVAVTTFPIDGNDVTSFLVEWIQNLRFGPALQAVIFGGVTIAGLGVVDIVDLAERLGTPALVVNRRDRTNHRLRQAFEAAGLSARLRIVEGMPPIFQVTEGLFAAAAGIDEEAATRLIKSTLAKSEFPEPLRIAHLIARALVRGESRGRP
jgi:endonuclease V-like protein UPF0215 family